MSAERSVHERMLAILAELPAIGKNQKNTQQGFMFRGHDDILNALNPLLAVHGVLVVPDVLARETAQRTTSKGNVMYEVNLHVRYRFYGAGGDWVEASTWGEGTDSGDKATNKAMTMAFKNALNQAFAISSAEFKDSDAETPETTLGRNDVARQGQPSDPLPETAAPTDQRTPGQVGMLRELLEALYAQQKRPEPDKPDRTWTDLANGFSQEQFGHDAGDRLTNDQYQQVIEYMRPFLKEGGWSPDLPSSSDIEFAP